MRAFFENVHFGGDAGFVQGQVEGDGVFGRDECIGRGAEEEGWRGRWGDVEFVGELFGEGWIGGITEEIFGGAFVGVVGGHGDDGIGKDDEVGAAVFAIDRIRSG